MGFLLKEVLKTLCGRNQWSYAVFWKIGCNNSKLLIWEECYYEPLTSPFSQLGIQEEDRVCTLINKMAVDNLIIVAGEGIIGRSAFTGSHQWVLLNNFTKDAYPPEVYAEVHHQFSAGMQTVAVIPVLPHGVVQLGSFLPIMENMGFVKDVQSLFLQLGCIPGALLSEDYSAKLSNESLAGPSTAGVPVSIVQTPCPSRGELNNRQVAPQTHNLNRVVEAKVLPSNLDSRQQQHSVPYNAKSAFDNLPGSGPFGQSGLSDRGLKYTERQIISAMESQNHGNSCINVSSSLNTSQLKTERSLNLDHNLSSGSTSLLRGIPVHNGMDSLLRRNLITSSKSPKVSAGNLSRAQFGNGLQNENSPKARGQCPTNFTSRGTFPMPLEEGSDQKILPIDSRFASTGRNTDYDLFYTANIPSFNVEEHLPISCQSVMTANPKDDEACAQLSSGDDLFDVLGVDFKNQLLNGKWNKHLGDESDANVENMVKKEICMNVAKGTNSDYCYSVNESISESGIFFSEMETDNLLDAVVSKATKQTVNQNSDDVSCRTTLTGSSTSSIPSPVGRKVISGNFQGKLFDFSKNGIKAGAIETSSLRSGCGKDEAGNCSQTTTIYGSQLSSLVENGGNVKRENSVSTGYSKRPNEANKSNRKRLKPGENPRPRPKDRQMIQDRVKELREIVPNGGKCSIDALLERTIKHMLFLQSVTKHADKLKQTGESKIISKEDGLLLKDNFEGGATWAYEVGSQSMVCPIIVEDLNPPRQMLVEMLCEERGFFLEIADLIRGLGLIILKGKMEVHNDKIWARFAVEANRDVTRMEIFMSLVHVLEQTMKGSASSSNAVDDIMGYPSFPTGYPDTSNWKA